jgi:hypothetical protein
MHLYYCYDDAFRGTLAHSAREYLLVLVLPQQLLLLLILLLLLPLLKL